jgi:hypothetical protein
METKLRIQSSVYPDVNISESEWNNQFNVSKMFSPQNELFQNNLMNHEQLNKFIRNSKTSRVSIWSLFGTNLKNNGKIQQVYRFGIQSIKRRLR